MVFKGFKSQAALEFLTTYGWAFIVILIVVAAIAYFGILTPSRLLPSRCNFGAEFQCLEYSIRPAEFRVRLKNGAGVSIDAHSLSVSTESAVALVCAAPALAPGLANWRSGEIRELLFTACNGAAAGLVPGEKNKIFVSMGYINTGGVAGATPPYAKNLSGEIFTAVLPT